MTQAQKQAMLLAAGLGKRMRPHTDSLPKPLVEAAGRKLIDYSLDLLTTGGVEAFVVNTHYMPEKIEAYLATRTSFDVTVSREPELLETGGGIRRVLPQLQESFFVLNSDIICTDSQPPVLQRMRQFWDAEAMDGLLLLVPLEQASGYHGAGDFSLDSHGRLKPREAGKPAYVFSGVQLLHRRFFAEANEEKFSLSLLYRQALQRSPCRLFGLVHTARWFHVGDPDGLAQAERELHKPVLQTS